MLVSRVNEEWVKGELRGSTGIFPTSFVDTVPADLPQEAKKEETKKEDTASSSSAKEEVPPNQSIGFQSVPFLLALFLSPRVARASARLCLSSKGRQTMS